jgi:glycosyltransferase involved in cell wall biosynthesis
MKFAIITHVIHKKLDNRYFAYAPYVREMNVWAAFVSELIVVGSVKNKEPEAIDIAYQHDAISFFEVDAVDLLSLKSSLNALLKLPLLFWRIFKAMYQADHIHLRCPGNIGLLGCLIQILFPFKPKTAKYAGNWDPKAKQPWSYRLQKWILNNTFLTRNMQVLVYGLWEGSTKNIKPFFTATYSERDKKPLQTLNLHNKIQFVFVGTLSNGKNPLYAIQIVEDLHKKGYNIHLKIYGEGIERNKLEGFIEDNNLKSIIELQGNQSHEVMKNAYQNSHFVILPSKSEGWPKAIAEGMFWGCVPIATSISCVPFMIEYGDRGILLKMNLDYDVQQIVAVLKDESTFLHKRERAAKWSRQYTLDVFENDIKKLLDQ